MPKQYKQSTLQQSYAQPETRIAVVPRRIVSPTHKGFLQARQNYLQPRQQVRVRRPRVRRPRLTQSNYQDASYRVLPDEEKQSYSKREEYNDNPFGTSKNYRNDDDDDGYNPVSQTDQEYVTEQTRRMDELKIKKHEMNIANAKGKIARRGEREQLSKEKREALEKKRQQIRALRKRIYHQEQAYGLVRGLAGVAGRLIPRVKINPAGRLANIRAAVSQADNYNARNTFFKKKETSKISFLGKGNV